MKLISKGNLQNIKYAGSCKKCGSTFEAEIHELNVIHDRDGQLAKETCTECGSDFWLYPKKSSLQPMEC